MRGPQAGLRGLLRARRLKGNLSPSPNAFV